MMVSNLIPSVQIEDFDCSPISKTHHGNFGRQQEDPEELLGLTQTHSVTQNTKLIKLLPEATARCHDKRSFLEEQEYKSDMLLRWPNP